MSVGECLVSELSRLVDALLGALVEFDPGSWSGADCAVLAERLARASKACDTASARAAVRASECGKVLERPDVFLARVSGSTAFAARTALLRVQSDRRVQRVNLHLALGGSFDPRPTEDEKTKTGNAGTSELAQVKPTVQ